MEDKCYCVLIWLGMNKESIPLQITNVSITNGQCLIHTTTNLRTAQTGLSLVSSWGLACYYSVSPIHLHAVLHCQISII